MRQRQNVPRKISVMLRSLKILLVKTSQPTVMLTGVLRIVMLRTVLKIVMLRTVLRIVMLKTAVLRMIVTLRIILRIVLLRTVLRKKPRTLEKLKRKQPSFLLNLKTGLKNRRSMPMIITLSSTCGSI